MTLKRSDREVFDIIKREKNREDEMIELIASENFVSEAVMEACGSVLVNKYSEGYPGNRYYGGCQFVDEIETLCQNRFLELFNCEKEYGVNVQPHSGSQANFAVYNAFLKPGDTIMAMSLDNGGHLTHGSSVNMSGKLYNCVFYNVDNFGYIDYDDFYEKIWYNKPKLIIAGASAYPREIDFERMREIIELAKKDIANREYNADKEYNPIFMVDMSHIAGLVATGYHQSPFDYADVITTTTHKTLRCARGAIIFAKNEYIKKINSSVFPGCQGGPLENMIAGKCVGVGEALKPEYDKYIKNVVNNTKAMANVFVKNGFKLTTGGTDNHLFLVDFSETHPHITGRMVQDYLEKEFGIIVNKNCVPNEKRSPKEASGIRVGGAAETTKGKTIDDFINIAETMCKAINKLEDINS